MYADPAWVEGHDTAATRSNPSGRAEPDGQHPDCASCTDVDRLACIAPSVNGGNGRTRRVTAQGCCTDCARQWLPLLVREPLPFARGSGLELDRTEQENSHGCALSQNRDTEAMA